MPAESAAAPSSDGAPNDDAAFVAAASPTGAAQPTALFPIRESSDSAEPAAVVDAAEDSRSAIALDAQSRRNQSFEELVRDIARDEERLHLISRAAPSRASLLSRT
jgi:hypothetical protein